jgi:hypothetical protein
MELLIIDLDKLQLGIPNLTPRTCSYYYERSIYCLNSQKHQSGATISIRNSDQNLQKFVLIWSERITEQIIASCQDIQDTTKDGAYGIALMVFPKFCEYDIIATAPKGFGNDFWFFSNDPENPIKARLEVKGIRNGDESLINRRLKEARKQLDKPLDFPLPTYIIVVEFSKLIVQVEIYEYN